jgi:hypothetical protein
MPFARIKPLNEGRGYKLRSYAAGSDIRMQIGPNPENPLWYVVTKQQAQHLSEQRINRDPASACKFDILPTKEDADIFMKLEAEKKKQSAAGSSVAEAIPLSPELARAAAIQASEVDALKKMVADLQAQLRSMKAAPAAENSVVLAQVAPEAFEAPGPSQEVLDALEEQPEPEVKSTTLTSSATAPAAAGLKRPTKR